MRTHFCAIMRVVSSDSREILEMLIAIGFAL